MSSACNCCAEPPYPEVYLEWVGTSAAKFVSLCGVTDPTDTETYAHYLTKTTSGDNRHTTIYTYRRDENQNCQGPVITCSGADVTGQSETTTGYADDSHADPYLEYGPPFYFVCGYDATDTVEDSHATLQSSLVYAEDCSTTLECEGSTSGGSSGTSTGIPYPGTSMDCGSSSYSDTCSGTYVLKLQPKVEPTDPDVYACEWETSGSYTNTDSEDPGPNVWDGTDPCPIDDENETYQFEETVVGPEDTTFASADTLPVPVLPAYKPFPTWPSDVVAGSPALLPTQSRGQSTGFGSVITADHSLNQSTYLTTIHAQTLYNRKAKWRVVHNPTASCYLKVWVKVEFEQNPLYPAVGSPPPPSEVTYEWSGTGSPCLVDVVKSIDAEGNLVKGGDNEVATELNGWLKLSVVKFSCVAGYTPADSYASGFPPSPP